MNQLKIKWGAVLVVFVVIYFIWSFPSFNSEEYSVYIPRAWKKFNTKQLKWQVEESDPSSFVTQSTIKVVTYNVLYDSSSEVNCDEIVLFENQKKDSSLRLKGLFDVLQNTEADVLCLQEVTQKIADLLMMEVWVQEKYWVSEYVESKAKDL